MKECPFCKKINDDTMRKAQDYGFLSTIQGRRCRFDLWESVN